MFRITAQPSRTRAWVPAFAGMTALKQSKIKMGPSLRWDDGLQGDRGLAACGA